LSFYKAKVVNGKYISNRTFYDFTNALEWLSSFAYGERSIDGITYTLPKIRELLEK